MGKRIRIVLENGMADQFNDVVNNMKSIMQINKVSKRDAVKFLIENYRFSNNYVKKKARSKNEFQFI